MSAERAAASSALEAAVVAACEALRDAAEQFENVGEDRELEKALDERERAMRLERALRDYVEAAEATITRLQAQLHEPSRGPRRNDLNTRAVLDAIASAAHGWADDGTRHAYVPTQLPGRVAALYSRSLRLAKLRTEIKTLLELEA